MAQNIWMADTSRLKLPKLEVWTKKGFHWFLGHLLTHVPAARVTVESENPFGPQMLPEIVPKSIDFQAPQQLGIPAEGDEGFDQDASY